MHTYEVWSPSKLHVKIQFPPPRKHTISIAKISSVSETVVYSDTETDHLIAENVFPRSLYVCAERYEYVDIQ
jgi:hypothetical protein